MCYRKQLSCFVNNGILVVISHTKFLQFLLQQVTRNSQLQLVTQDFELKSGFIPFKCAVFFLIAGKSASIFTMDSCNALK